MCYVYFVSCPSPNKTVFLLLNMLPNSFGMVALRCNARLDCSDRLHSQDHPLENSLVLWLKLLLRLPSGDVSGSEIPNQNAVIIWMLITNKTLPVMISVKFTLEQRFWNALAFSLLLWYTSVLIILRKLKI